MHSSRLISFALLLAASAAAQTTTVTGTLADSFGATAAKLTATCAFRAGATFTSAAGWIVTGPAHVVTVTGGALSVALVPTDSSNPSSYHEMRCHIPLQTADGRVCEGNSLLLAQGICVVGPVEWGPIYLPVPTSPTPVALKDIYRTARPPAPPLLLLPAQIDARAVADGTQCLAVAAGRVTGLTACAGGGGLSGAATWAQLEAGTAGTGSITATMTWAQIEAL